MNGVHKHYKEFPTNNYLIETTDWDTQIKRGGKIKYKSIETQRETAKTNWNDIQVLFSLHNMQMERIYIFIGFIHKLSI
jgi:hypothetical protein